jgi:hypothetical protein
MTQGLVRTDDFGRQAQPGGEQFAQLVEQAMSGRRDAIA